MNVELNPTKLTPNDFASDQEVRWCPGCGDYAILKCIQRTMPEVGATRENTVFISGIGCSSRFPYYMSTYGFHTIHGRAPAIATGVKLANPELDVWMITGDGDGLSIGGNHMLHVLRRNVNINILLFNNEIYGLTKGQYSPTSKEGTRAPSTPYGSIDRPLNPCAFALGAGARFVARTIDTAQKHMPGVFKAAQSNIGASFVEIFQNCIVYNEDVFADFTNKKVAADHQLLLEHGQAMIFGKEKNKGLRIKPGTISLEVVTVGEDGITEADLLVHDQTNKVMANMLVDLDRTAFPVALGVIYADPVPSFEEAVHTQAADVQKKIGKGNLNALIRQGRTWEVE
jgi:2-oxoglutarate/2-oxoacid ferredoxin oxidoreductase subunit beta